MSKIFSSSDFILIDDSGADQSIINLNEFSTFICTCIYFDVGDATSKMKATVPLKLVNKAYTLAILYDRTRVVFGINQAFYDTYLSQTKALLVTH